MIPQDAYRVVGVRPDGVHEVCAAGVSRQTAESVATTVRSMRNYTQVLIESESDHPEAGTRSREWI